MDDLKTKWNTWAGGNTDIVALPFLLLGVVLLLTLATGGEFLQYANLGAMMSQMPEIGLLSLAMMVPMLTAGINLSIISSANFAGVLMGLVLTKLIPTAAGTPQVILMVLAAVAIGLMVSIILGMVNGVLIAYLGIPAVLVTLGTMILFEGLTLSITRGFVISGFPDMFQAIGNGRLFGVIPYSLLVFAAAALVMSYVLKRRPFGKYLYMIGSSEKASRYSSINTRLVLVKAYVVSGVLAGLAAIIMTSRFNSANARQGSSFLLLTVLISVLGGTDPNGGFGKVSGLVMALVILQCVTSGLNLIGVSSFVTLALWGSLLVLVIAYRFFLHKKHQI